MKINAWSLRPVTCPAQTRVFVDEDQESGAAATITLTLRPLTNPEQAEAFERGEQLTALFVTGDRDSGRSPMEFPAVGGRNVPISRTLLHNAAALEMMQAGEISDRYTAVEMAALSAGISTSVWREILAWVSELERGAAVRDATSV